MSTELLRDIIRYAPGRMLTIVAGFAFYPVVTRLFEPAEYGKFALAIAGATLLSTFGGWTATAVIRFYPVAEKSHKRDALVAGVLRLCTVSVLTLGLLVLALILLARSRLPANGFPLLIAGLAYFAMDSFFIVLASFLRSRRQVLSYSWFIAWKLVMGMVFGVTLVVALELGVAGLIWGYCLSVALALPLLWVKVVGKKAIAWSGGEPVPAGAMIRYSFPLVGAGMAAWILSVSDRYMLEILRPSVEVGIYSVGYDIADRSIMVIVTLFAQAFTPLAVILWETQERAASQAFLSDGTRYFLLMGIPAVIGISVLREPIVHLLTTPAYYPAAEVVPFVATGVLLLGLSQRFYTVLGVHNKTLLIMYSLLSAALLNLLLNYLLIPLYGFAAAALTTLICYGLLMFAVLRMSRRLLAWSFPLGSVLRATFAAAVMGGLVHLTSNVLLSGDWLGVALGVVVGAVSYLLCLVIVRELRKEEVEKLTALIRKWMPIAARP